MSIPLIFEIIVYIFDFNLLGTINYIKGFDDFKMNNERFTNIYKNCEFYLKGFIKYRNLIKLLFFTILIFFWFKIIYLIKLILSV